MMKVKEIFRYLVMLVVLALPLIVGFLIGLTEKNILLIFTYTGNGTTTPFDTALITPALSLSFYVELLWFFPVAIFILPRMIGKPENEKVGDVTRRQ